MFLLSSLALAAPVETRPWAFVKPGFAWIADSDAVVTDQDGLLLYGEMGLDAAYEPAKVGGRVSLVVVPDVQLKDAVITWAPSKYLRLDVGQFKVPMGVGYLASDSRRLLPRASLAAGEVASTDLGLGLTGALVIQDKSWAQLSTGVYNGEGPNRIQNVNQRFLFSQRLLFTPFGPRTRAFEGTNGTTYLGLGGSWVWNVIGEGATAEEYNHFGGELQFAWNVLSVQGEVFFGDHRFASADLDDYTFLGGYGQLGLYLPFGWAARHLELVGRVGEDDPDQTVEGEVGGQIGPATLEITGGLNLYALDDPDRFHDFKLQLAFTHFRELEGEEVADDTFVAMGVARF